SSGPGVERQFASAADARHARVDAEDGAGRGRCEELAILRGTAAKKRQVRDLPPSPSGRKSPGDVRIQSQRLPEQKKNYTSPITFGKAPCPSEAVNFGRILPRRPGC